MITEMWQSVRGFEGLYEVSEAGRVRSMRTRAELTGGLDRDGYRRVTLTRAGTQQTMRVHRLVCEAFNGPPPFTTALVRHLNGAPDDNRYQNLAWGTYHDNEADKRDHGRTARGEEHGRAKLTDDAVKDIRSRYGVDRSAEIAAQYGVHRTLVWQIGTGRGWGHIA